MSPNIVLVFGDQFLPGSAYLKKWGYEVDETGTVPYQN